MNSSIQGAVNISLKLTYSEHSMAKVNKKLKKTHEQNYNSVKDCNPADEHFAPWQHFAPQNI